MLKWLSSQGKILSFIYRWWELQTDKRKEEVKNLIQEGRLEIINAGWSMNDEA